VIPSRRWGFGTAETGRVRRDPDHRVPRPAQVVRLARRPGRVDLAIPADTIQPHPRPSGTGKSVLVNAPDRAAVPRHRRRGRPGPLGCPSSSSPSCFELRTRFGICSRTARCSARCRSTTTSPSRYASTRTSPRPRSARSSCRGLADVGLGRPPLAPAQPALRWDAQARRLRARARDGPEIVLFDEATLGWTRSARACCASSSRKSSRPRRRLHRHHAQHHGCAPHRRVRRPAVERQDRGRRGGGAMFGSEDPFIRQFLSGEPGGPLGMD